jgi:hypothetical protein
MQYNVLPAAAPGVAFRAQSTVNQSRSDGIGNFGFWTSEN